MSVDSFLIVRSWLSDLDYVHGDDRFKSFPVIFCVSQLVNQSVASQLGGSVENERHFIFYYKALGSIRSIYNGGTGRKDASSAARSDEEKIEYRMQVGYFNIQTTAHSLPKYLNDFGLLTSTSRLFCTDIIIQFNTCLY